MTNLQTSLLFKFFLAVTLHFFPVKQKPNKIGMHFALFATRITNKKLLKTNNVRVCVYNKLGRWINKKKHIPVKPPTVTEKGPRKN